MHGDRVRSRRELLTDARRIAAALRVRGIGPGRFVLIRTEDPVATVRAIVGTVLSAVTLVGSMSVILLGLAMG